MKSKSYRSITDLAIDLGLSENRGDMAIIKANLTKEIIKAINKKKVTHQEVADLSGVPRSAITGIINGSLQKITIDRLVRVINSLGKKIEFKIKNVA